MAGECLLGFWEVNGLIRLQVYGYNGLYWAGADRFLDFPVDGGVGV